MNADARMSGWYAEAERPVYTCVGGPLDGAAVSPPRGRPVYEDAACRESGGVYLLRKRAEGRFVVPVAIWHPKQGQE